MQWDYIGMKSYAHAQVYAGPGPNSLDPRKSVPDHFTFLFLSALYISGSSTPQTVTKNRNTTNLSMWEKKPTNHPPFEESLVRR